MDVIYEIPVEFWWGAALASAVVLLVVWWVLRVRAWWRRRKLYRQGRRAKRAEVRAERVLLRAGLTPVDDQVYCRWPVLVDGETEEIRLFADWIVESQGRRFVVEVKTGARAPSIKNASTRRQLLEYRCAFDVDGVILLDMESETLHVVEFPSVDRLP